MKSRRSLILPVIAGCSLLFATLHIARTHETPRATQPPVPPSQSPYSDVIAGAGLVEARSENIKVATELPGIVTEVAVTVGQQVRKGDVLFQLSDRDRRAILAVRQAGLAMAEAEFHRTQALPRPEDIPVSQAAVDRARADLGLQQDQLNRAEALFARKVTTQEEYTQRQLGYAASRAELSRAEAEDARLKAGAWKEDLQLREAEVARARHDVEQARIDVERLTVRAPIDGTILKVDVRPGEYVGTPPNQTLMLLGDLTELHVRVDIDENDLPRFRPGLPGTGYLRGDASHPLKLDFVRVERFAEPKKSLTGAGNERVDTRVLQVIYRILPAEQTVYVGQQIDVYLDAAAKVSIDATSGE